MNTDELRAQALAEHESDIAGWIDQKRTALKQSLVDRLANNQKEHEEIAAQLESLEPAPEEQKELPTDEATESEQG